MKAYVGIDPGLTGAIAVYRPEIDPDLTPNLEIFDMPVTKVVVSGKKATRKKKSKKDDGKVYRNVLVMEKIRDILKVRASNAVLALVEAPHSLPGESAVGAHKFGICCGAVLMAPVALDIPTLPVSPQWWHAAAKVKGGKENADAVRAAATKAFPESAHLFTRGKDDGRADAALLAKLAADMDAKMVEQLYKGKG